MGSSKQKNFTIKRDGICLQKHPLKVGKQNLVLALSFGRCLVVEGLAKIVLNEVKNCSVELTRSWRGKELSYPAGFGLHSPPPGKIE